MYTDDTDDGGVVERGRGGEGERGNVRDGKRQHAECRCAVRARSSGSGGVSVVRCNS